MSGKIGKSCIKYLRFYSKWPMFPLSLKFWLVSILQGTSYLSPFFAQPDLQSSYLNLLSSFSVSTHLWLLFTLISASIGTPKQLSFWLTVTAIKSIKQFWLLILICPHIDIVDSLALTFMILSFLPNLGFILSYFMRLEFCKAQTCVFPFLHQYFYIR